MPKYIEREIIINDIDNIIEILNKPPVGTVDKKLLETFELWKQRFLQTPTADVVKVVRCKNCKHCYQLAPHSEINRGLYFHCGLWRGEETKNVWHKYKKYYADYSLVCADDYCSSGELKEREG